MRSLTSLGPGPPPPAPPGGSAPPSQPRLQRIQVGLPHAGTTAEITIGSDTYQIRIDHDIAITAPRTTSRDIKRHKASRYPDRGGHHG